MAYSRYRRRSTRYRRRRPTRRVSRVVRRRPRTTRTRRPMTRRRILDVTSTKKQDNMQVYTNMGSTRNQGSTTYTATAAILPGGFAEEYCMPFLASARSIHTGTTDVVNRNTSRVYARGLKENVEINIASGRPWQWRRLAFYSKGLMANFGATTSFFTYVETSNGYARVVNEISGQTKLDFYSFLFDGVRTVDWNDPMIAKTDSNRVSVCYDKTMTISPQTTAGSIRSMKRWHPVNKSLVYEDDENGVNMIPSSYSTTGRQGVGDLTIVDLFRPAAGSATSDQLTFAPQATWYWHEK